MIKLVLYRAMSAIPLLFVASVLIFLLIFLVPGSPVTAILGDSATPEAIAQTEHQLGLDQPLLTQYLHWMGGMLTGDMGTSIEDGTSVSEIVRNRFPVTFALATFSMLCSLLIGLPLGIVASLRPGSAVDRGLTIMTSFGLAVPSFWLALLLILLLSVKLDLLPIASYTRFSVDPSAWFVSLIMPALAVGLTSGAVIARQTRSAMLEALESPYMQTVRALGLRRRTAVLRYALKNAMVPVLTVIGFQMGHALGGSIIMESIFAIPGVGAQLILSVIDKDFPVVRAITLMTALVMVVVYLLVDIGYGLIDARARPQ
jgi:peptide/nickel transport system permease protein